MVDERHDPNFITDAAGSLLSKKFGERVRLLRGKTFTAGGSVVVRCEVIDRRPDLPASFVVKKVREDEFSYRPDSPERPNPAHWLFNEWPRESASARGMVERLGRVWPAGAADLPYCPAFRRHS